MCQWKGEEVGVGEELGVWTAFRPKKLESTQRYHLRPKPELLLYIDLLEQMFYSARHFFNPDSILNYLLLLFFCLFYLASHLVETFPLLHATAPHTPQLATAAIFP